ncbi:MAG: glycosyltransferase [Acidobacteria bacterium]|nr:glycosyltransferase [Acidobacteriota bacterium]
MNRRIAQLLFSVLAIGLVVVAVLLLFGSFRLTRLELTDIFLFSSTMVLFVFLLTLVLRYLALLVLAFLQHLRYANRSKELTEYPSVTVVVPAYNEERVIEACIRSVMELDYPNLETIVVDDGSSDHTYYVASKLIERYGSDRLRVLTQPNSGKATALNHGISHARGEILLCVDADSRLEPDAVLKAIPNFNDPTIGAVAGNVRVANRRNLLTRLQALEYIEGLNLVRAAQAVVGRVAVVPGPVGFFRKTVMDEIGGYTTDTYAEDCELTLRIMLSGWKIQYEPQAIAWTEAPEDARALFQQRYRWGRGILQAINKHRGQLLRPAPDPLSWAMLWMLAFESVALPAMDIIGMLVFIFAGITGGLSPLIVLWWVQLAILDTVIAMYCVVLDREDVTLPVYAVLYRLYFVPFVDLMRFFAWLDELFEIRMGWLRLERLGRI